MTRKALVNIPKLLKCMAGQRPLFHSEADMQHELAWRIRKSYPSLGVRLEYPFERTSNKVVDIWLRDRNSGKEMGLELKYLTGLLECEVEGEKFGLKAQSAHDVRRYDTLKDVMRMEQFLDSEESPCARSAAVLVLTNDPAYWKKRQLKGQNDAAFTLHKGAEAKGTLNWAPDTAEGTKRGREGAIELRNAYDMKWRDYSRIENCEKNERFRFLHIPVTQPAGSSESITE